MLPIRTYAYGAIGAAVIGSVLYIGYLRHRVTSLEEDRAGLAAALKTQSDEVQRWKDEANQRRQAGLDALEKANAERDKAIRTAQDIYKRKPQGNSCEAALRLMNE